MEKWGALPLHFKTWGAIAPSAPHVLRPCMYLQNREFKLGSLPYCCKYIIKVLSYLLHFCNKFDDDFVKVPMYVCTVVVLVVHYLLYNIFHQLLHF